MKHEQGFTLIEAIVALAIAATALVVLMGRLGASADIQHTLAMHELALDVASNELARESMEPSAAGTEKSGTLETGGMTLNWRSWTEKTMLDGFVRRNIAVNVPGETEVTLFLYQEVR
ncbi:MAG: type II secretion system protein GspI [Zetaproteobacteria bacterium CG12_big_fil_rev_8_21_14_0_65_54_13]|nr:MAG: type II secretion system protein GspI [Zetaproteobacteria bacterium CG23_combo_of_CG06-09_8_20_14_all_54_7]PIW49825.1 MAG: type II secretion system protein GspI [Zetaproteobacteria bacterium CG12_big_fil_rev_8_21_14_0_65_54_13]PIX54394.1 MAG: type II secretion system protein GspI [Zetaproteobacteria bacterium CG_4_10_14_3_um_filter_54_28]PJA31146.1 MAG: type II secretion system protein GspI [Zetaproteobacteria bacterium CG_4_9_14_3_um_filter_54_145]